MKMQMEASKSLISMKKILVPQFFLFLKVFQAVCIDNMLFVWVLKNVYVWQEKKVYKISLCNYDNE